MLILSRKIGEEIEVSRDGQRIGRIVLVGWSKNQARIGFEFDRSFEFIRDDAKDKSSRVSDGKPLIGPFPHVELPKRGEGYQS